MKVLPADILPAAHESSEKASAHGLMLPELVLVLFYKRPQHGVDDCCRGHLVDVTLPEGVDDVIVYRIDTTVIIPYPIVIGLTAFEEHLPAASTSRRCRIVRISRSLFWLLILTSL